MDEQLRIILIIIVSVSIFGLLVFVFVKNVIRNRIQSLVEDEEKEKNYKELIAVSYSSELKQEILEIHQKYKITSHQKMKSSLKFCVVATSEFDLYVAEPRACEWDIAAGHAILVHAGGKITDFNGDEIFYGKPDFKNPSLILKNKNVL